ncbi:MAG TPA: serine hydrolase domain-containing protein, partial [Longimicrobiaceae bacterium]|nr:serine hydrolase domain-containing protein [Longimicrobiaceae bacterium]
MIVPLLLSLAIAGDSLGAAVTAVPARARLDLSDLVVAEATVQHEVQRGGFPGAALAVGRGDHAIVEEGIGTTDWGATPVDPDRTMYDLASLTKVVATTTAVMLLVEDGKMSLDAPVSRYLPEFSGGAKDRVTIRQLLTHTSGLPAWRELWGTPDEALYRAITTPLVREPGTRVEYSDVGFVVLFAAAQRAAGEPLPELLRRRVWAPLGMNSTM